MEEGESAGGSREQDSLYGNEIEANKETNSGAFTNTMDRDINSEPGPGRADKNVIPKIRQTVQQKFLNQVVNQ